MTSERTKPRLEGRVAIVSGGARGIGEAHVRALAGEGAHVVIGDVLADEGAALAGRTGRTGPLGHARRHLRGGLDRRSGGGRGGRLGPARSRS